MTFYLEEIPNVLQGDFLFFTLNFLFVKNVIKSVIKMVGWRCQIRPNSGQNLKTHTSHQASQKQDQTGP